MIRWNEWWRDRGEGIRALEPIPPPPECITVRIQFNKVIVSFKRNTHPISSFYLSSLSWYHSTTRCHSIRPCILFSMYQKVYWKASLLSHYKGWCWIQSNCQDLFVTLLKLGLIDNKYDLTNYFLFLFNWTLQMLKTRSIRKNFCGILRKKNSSTRQPFPLLFKAQNGVQNGTQMAWSGQLQ